MNEVNYLKNDDDVIYNTYSLLVDDATEEPFPLENPLNEKLIKKELTETTSEKRLKEKAHKYLLFYNYFTIGIIYSGTVSILYPLLVIKHGVTSTYFMAASNLVTIFWSFKICFGFLCELFSNKKVFLILGWIICALFLILLSIFNYHEDMSNTNLVLLLTICNFGYVMSTTAADGFAVSSVSSSSNNDTKIQSIVYKIRETGRILINIIILFSFSGAEQNCPGYEADESKNCTTNESVKARNELVEEYPETWCHMQCDEATFDFGLSISEYTLILVLFTLLNFVVFRLQEEKQSLANSTPRLDLISKCSKTLQRQEVCQLMLFSIIVGITANITNSAKTNANFLWLHLSNFENQLLTILKCCVFFAGLYFIRKFLLDISWYFLMVISILFKAFFDACYLIITFNLYRNVWFYILIECCSTMMTSISFIIPFFCVVEMMNEQQETFLYALITTGSNGILPLANVLSYQFLALFPSLITQESLDEDSSKVRTEYMYLLVITISINLTALVALPLLPQQKQQTKELIALRQTSAAYAIFTFGSALLLILYATIATFLTVAGDDEFGCYKLFGGPGCSDQESNVGVVLCISFVLLYCYIVSLFHIVASHNEINYGWQERPLCEVLSNNN